MTGQYSAYGTEIRDQALAGCPKSLRSLLPYSYLPLVRGRRIEEGSHLLCRVLLRSVNHEVASNPFFRTLLCADESVRLGAPFVKAGVGGPAQRVAIFAGGPAKRAR